MKESSYEFASDKNALPMHRYAPYKLKYQIVIDVVEGDVIGSLDLRRTYYVWKVTKVSDVVNLIEKLTSYEHDGSYRIGEILDGLNRYGDLDKEEEIEDEE